MIKFFKLLFIITVILFINLNSSSFVRGQNSFSNKTNYELDLEVQKINDEIEKTKENIKKLQNNQQKYSDIIKLKQGEQVNLNNQIAILDSRIAKAQLGIQMKEAEISKTEMQIEKTNLEIKNKEDKIDKEKENIAAILKILNRQDNTSQLEILLLNDSLTDFISQIKYLEDINKALGDSIDELIKLKEGLIKNKTELEKQKTELEKQKAQLENQKTILASETASKKYILDQVKDSEKEFQKLYAQAKEEEENANIDLINKEKEVREKLAKLKNNQLNVSTGFIWPVSKAVITAYFHDPDYPFKKLFEHPAIDIAVKQGTPLKAASGGYVGRVKTGGKKGYGYIMLVHADGFATVYGHVSKINVKEDEYVQQGQIIGLSGGIPGTPGAGPFTTGPHLHFEIRKDGIPVDPLEYLP